MRLEGKIIDFLGDSITEGTGVEDIENNRFDNIMLRECKLKAVHNYGIGGTRFAHQRIPSSKPRYDLCFCGRIYDLDDTADIIVVYGGVNDYAHGDAPIGNLDTDKTPATFCGSVNFLMSNLKKMYSGKTIVFITPARCCFYGMPDELRSKMSSKIADAQPLEYYVEVIKRAGREHSVFVLDLYNDLGINPNNEAEAKKYTSDGLHFNDEGHKVIAKCLTQFLESL